MERPRQPVRVGVFGTGVMGGHHVRLLSEIPGAELVGIFDAEPEVARSVAAQYGSRVFDSSESLASEIEAAVVAAPTSSAEKM